MSHALWFFDRGIGVFPIVTRGKTPACLSWDDYTCTRQQAARFRNYGVRLGKCRTGWLAVVDTDTPETEAWVAANLPDTPFKVRTAHGWHRDYRVSGPLPKHIHRDKHSIEFRNQGQYVVGPGSVHSTGAIYTASVWSWRWEDIPFFPADFDFDDGTVASCLRSGGSKGPLVLPDTIPKSERHDTLYALVRSLVARCVPLDGALAACHLENLAKCRPPLDRDELDAYLRRSYRQPDSAGFVRTPATAMELAGSLFEIGMSWDALMAACRSINPDFDPMEPEPSLEPDAPTMNLNLDLDAPEGLI
jgi:hypothetical protein